MGTICATDSGSYDNDIVATSQHNDFDADVTHNVENNAIIGDIKTKNVSNDSTQYIDKNNDNTIKTLKTASVEETVNDFDELKSAIESVNSGTLKVTLNVGNYVITSPITISKKTTIIVDGNGQTINGNGNLFIKITKDGCILNITDITISNCAGADGSVIYSPSTSEINMINSTFTNNSGVSGGVIYSKGIVTSINSTFKENTASYSGGVIWHAATGSKQIVNIINSTFTGNNATENGGAIFTQNNVYISNSQFIANNAIYQGGAVYTGSRNSTVTGSVFVNNSAKQNGGAIRHSGTSVSHILTVVNSTFTGNNATQFGGAIYSERSIIVNYSTFNNNNALYYGGAIYAPNINITIANSSFVKNHANQNGGAIDTSKLLSKNNTFTKNTAGWSGGAINVNKKATIEDSTFEDNKAEENGGVGFIYGELSVNNSVFKNNSALQSAGSLYTFNKVTINNSVFNNNSAQMDGGAIISYGNEISTIENTEFNSNNAESGGSLCSYINSSLNNVTFKNNNATMGGAIVSIGYLSILNSEFDNNTAVKQGGAICSLYSNTTVNSTTFTNNHVTGFSTEYILDDSGGYVYDTVGQVIYDPTNPEHANVNTTVDYYGDGGAIYTTSNLTSDNNSFINNSAMVNGGAIYADGNSSYIVTVNNNTFINNNVTQKGGALYSQCNLTINDSIFKNNNAKINKSDIQDVKYDTRGGTAYCSGVAFISNSSFSNSTSYRGGAVYMSGELTSVNNTFTNNSASIDGGAVFASRLFANDTIFDNNNASDGGAISATYIIDGNNVSFTNNCAIHDGGAILLYWETQNMSLNNCSFVNNSGYDGGAIRAGSNSTNVQHDSNVIISNTTFDKNHGFRGAALFLNNTKVTLKSSNITNNTADVSSTVATYYTSIYINDTLFEDNYADTIGLTLSEYSNITINNSRMINNSGNKSSVINSMNSHLEIHDTELINNSGKYGVIVSHVQEHYYYGYTGIEGCNLTGNIVTIELENEELNWHYNVIRSDSSLNSYNLIEMINNTFRNNTNFKHGMLFGDFADYYVTNNTYISNYLEVFNRTISHSFDNNENYVADVTLQIRDVCNSSVNNSKINVYVDNVLYKQFNVNENKSKIIIDKNTMENMKSDSIKLEFFSPRLDYHGFNWTVTLPQKINISINANNTNVGKYLPISGKIQTADGHVISSVNGTLIINNTEIPVEFNKYGLLEYNDYIPKTAGKIIISLKYGGSDIYYPSEASIIVNISGSKTILNVNPVKDNIYNSTVRVYGNLSTADGPIRNTKINLSINGDVKEVDVDSNGQFEYKFKSTQLGENKVLISYLGNDLYDEANYLLKFNTNQLETIIEYDITNYTSKNEDENDYTFKYSQMLVLNGTLKDIRGNPLANTKVDVYVDGYEHKDLYSVTTDDEGVFNYTRTIRYMEDKNLIVSYNGNELYKSSNRSSHINVIKMGTKLTLLPIPYIEANTSCYIFITLEDEEGKPIENFTFGTLTNGYVKLILNNTPIDNIYNRGIDGSPEQLTKYRFVGTAKNLSEGNYTVHASYISNFKQKYYESSEDEFMLEVISGLSKIEIDEIPPMNRTLGDLLTVSGTLKDRHGVIIKNTNVSIFINGHEHKVDVDENGRFSLTTPIIEANTNHIRVAYDGNETYTPSSNTTTIEVNKSNTTLELYTDRTEEMYGEKLLIYGWLRGYDGTGRPAIPITLNLNIFKIELETNEKGYYEYWATTRFVGVNNVTVSVKESEDYNSAQNKTTFIMKKRTTNIILNVPEEMTIGEETVINGTLSGLYGKIKNNQLTLYINNGKYYVYTDDNGEFFLPYKATSNGIKNITVIFDGDEERLNSSNSKLINVVRKNTNITLSIDNYKPIYGENITISGTLTGENGEKIKNANVDLIINGKTHTLRVESTNQFHYTHHVTTSGLNNVTAKFVETGIYKQNSANTTFTVNKTDVVLLITQSQKNVQINDNLTINGILIDKKGHAIENARLLLTINNNKVTITTASEGYFYYRALQKNLGNFAGKITHLEEDSFNPASVEFTYTVVKKLSEDENKANNNSKIIKGTKSSFKIASEYEEVKTEVILENHNTTGYNHTEVFPHNTTVTIHEVLRHIINTNVTVISTGTPIYYEDGFMAYCIDRYRKPPIDSVIYDREEYDNQLRENDYTSEDVIKYLKTFIITHLNDNYNFTNEHDKQNVIWGFTDFSYRTQLDDHYKKVVIDVDGNPHSITEYINETIELVEAGHIPANEGTVLIGSTLYNYYFAYGNPDKYVADEEYQRSFGIYLYPLSIEFAWGFVLKNESTVENATEVYTENITELEEYDETVEINDTEEIIVPYNETVNVTVEHTREVPYNETVNVTKNITVTVPYTQQEEYTVNVTKQVPTIVQEEYTENVTKTVPYTVEEAYTVNETKEVPYTELEEYIVDVTKQVPYTELEEYIVNVTKQVPYTVVENYTVNVTKQVPYTELEEYIENVTKIVNYTVQENYTVNKTVYEQINKTVPVVKNRTITVPEIRYKNVTKYKIITEPVIRYHNVTKYKTITQPTVVYRNVTENRTVIVPEIRYRNVTKYKTVVEAVTKYRNVTKYRTVVEAVTKYRNVTKYKTVVEAVTKYRNVTKYNTVTVHEIKYKNVTKTETVVEPVTKYRNVTKYKTETEEVTKYRNVTVYNPVIVQETRYRNVTKYRDEIQTVTEEVTQTKYKNETYTEIVPTTVTKNRTETITVTKNRTYHYSRPVTHTVTKTRPYSYDNFKYKLYIYILYLNGNITYDDLVAVLGEENINFDENGEIILEYDDTINIPNYIQVRKSDDYTGEEDIPSSGDDIKLSNPNNLDKPVIDAGIVDVID